MINRHHITYDPEWIVELNGLEHKLITTMQRTKASPEKYARWTNMLHAFVAEWNRMRMELDLMEEEE